MSWKEDLPWQVGWKSWWDHGRKRTSFQKCHVLSTDAWKVNRTRPPGTACKKCFFFTVQCFLSMKFFYHCCLILTVLRIQQGNFEYMVGISMGKLKFWSLSAWAPKILAHNSQIKIPCSKYQYTYRIREEGGSGSPPPPSTIHLRTDDVRDNIHSHLCHAKRPMAVSLAGGGGGGGRWGFEQSGHFPRMKCDFCSEV